MGTGEAVIVMGKGKVRNGKGVCPRTGNTPTHQDKVVRMLEEQLCHNQEQYERTGSDYWKGAVESVERQIELAKEGDVEVLSRFVIGESHYQEPQAPIDTTIREYYADWARK